MQKATREQTKNHNTRLVLKTIYEQGNISRADIARATNLTRTTVSDIVAELMETGLLVETGMGESAGGKPPIMLKVQENARQLICLDLSERPFTGSLVDLRGGVRLREVAARSGAARSGATSSGADAGSGLAAGGAAGDGAEPCGESTPLTGEAALEQVYNLLDRLTARAEAPLVGIGIGVPGLTDIEKGVVRRSVRVGWSDLPLRGLLEARYHLPVYLINDSHAAALAEYTFGAMRGAPNLIVVRIVEGIGSGILLSGQLHYGDGYGAGEIGHLTVVEGGRLCSCGNYGCLETVASPSAIVQRMRELAEYDWISFAGKVAPADISWDFVRQAYAAGDETATELIQEAGRYLGVSIANLVSILNVKRIVISSCYSEFGDTFLEALRQEVRGRALQITSTETEIVYSSLGADIITLGVSALLLSKEMGLP